jgi:hypothetical protein
MDSEMPWGVEIHGGSVAGGTPGCTFGLLCGDRPFDKATTVRPTLVTKNRDIRDLNSYITADSEKSYGVKIQGGLVSGGTPGCSPNLAVYAKVQLKKFLEEGENNFAPRILRQITPQDLVEL